MKRVKIISDKGDAGFVAVYFFKKSPTYEPELGTSAENLKMAEANMSSMQEEFMGEDA
jgi:hypothetical protein